MITFQTKTAEISSTQIVNCGIKRPKIQFIAVSKRIFLFVLHACLILPNQLSFFRLTLSIVQNVMGIVCGSRTVGRTLICLDRNRLK